MLVVGLGNPGSKYQQTPHNLGFEVIDELAKRWGISPSKKFESEFFEHTLAGAKVWLLKPQTYMNLSGRAVQAASHFYKVEPKSILVLSDDLDLPPATLRLRMFGGAGGHNGLKSINECLGTQEYPRIRLGVGRHPHMPADVYLLSKVTGEDWTILMGAVKVAADAVEMALKEGLPKAMNTFNQKKDESREP